MNAVLRPARATDLGDLAAIEEAAFVFDRLSVRSFRGMLENPSADLLVAEDGGRIAGYCLVLARKGARIARLYSLAVAPERSRAGLGSALLAAAEDAARGRGREAMALEVRADNPHAAGLYERRGYRPTGRRPAFYADGCDALLYRKALSPPGGTKAPPPASPARRTGRSAAEAGAASPEPINRRPAARKRPAGSLHDLGHPHRPPERS